MTYLIPHPSSWELYEEEKSLREIRTNEVKEEFEAKNEMENGCVHLFDIRTDGGRNSFLDKVNIYISAS